MEKRHKLLVSGKRAAEILLVMPLLDHLIEEGWEIQIALYEFGNEDKFLQERSQNKYSFKLHHITPMPRQIHYLKCLLSNLTYLNERNIDDIYKRRESKRSKLILGDMGTKVVILASKTPKPIWNLLKRFLFFIIRSLVFIFAYVSPKIISKEIQFDAVLVVGGFFSSSGEDLVIVEAKKRRVPSFVYFRSHDTLNSKGTIAVVPTVFFVQNIWQKNLLLKRHQCHSKSLITGSIFFNYLESFRLKSSSKLETQKRLDSNKLALLFLSSSRSNFDGEIDLYCELRNEALLYEDTSVEVYVRPHPSVVDLWKMSIPVDQIRSSSHDLWERIIQTRDGCEDVFDAYFCVNTSGIMDMLVLNPHSKIFLLRNEKAKCQNNTSQYRNFLESGFEEYSSITEALKDLCKNDSTYDAYSKNLNIMKSLLPNNSNCINAIHRIIENMLSGKLTNDFSTERV